MAYAIEKKWSESFPDFGELKARYDCWDQWQSADSSPFLVTLPTSSCLCRNRLPVKNYMQNQSPQIVRWSQRKRLRTVRKWQRSLCFRHSKHLHHCVFVHSVCAGKRHTSRRLCDPMSSLLDCQHCRRLLRQAHRCRRILPSQNCSPACSPNEHPSPMDQLQTYRLGTNPNPGKRQDLRLTDDSWRLVTTRGFCGSHPQFKEAQTISNPPWKKASTLTVNPEEKYMIRFDTIDIQNHTNHIRNILSESVHQPWDQSWKSGSTRCYMWHLNTCNMM